ncbi:hypothetical protein BD626DRAFT_522865 [Schizophyllum amplum]|uniref:Uncharacterized protein n=1 Tax=Schizophyllum amplum TaxID=97359 RepID=A0A550BTA4_9AGAR|nr:hypothetical protein BD626DRAFT_522865 [Auriculariopsis ampla]
MEYNAARTRRFVSQNLSYIIIFSAVVVFARIYTSRTLISLSTVPEEIVEVDPHPIPQLIVEAFERILARQSRTLEDAAAEYRAIPQRVSTSGGRQRLCDGRRVRRTGRRPRAVLEISGEELAHRALQVRV